MKKPNLFIPGFAKSGTSSLHSMLLQHPEISGGKAKEPHTYSWDFLYKKRFSFFKKAYADCNSKYILESSTSYLPSRNAVNRIIKDTPEAKFIVIARDPVDRIVSHYNWLSKKGLVDKQFNEEIKAHSREKFDYRIHYAGNFKAYIDFSKYGEQMQHLHSVVPQDQILFLTFEEVFKNWESVSPRIGEFLNLDLRTVGIKKENITQEKRVAKKLSFFKRLLERVKYEIRVLKGYPRTKLVRNPIDVSVTREQSENLLLPLLEGDYHLLEQFNYDLSHWKTNGQIKQNL